MGMAGNNLHIHVPTPGDHYSPATGSGVMTAIYELSRAHARCGGETHIIVGKGTRHDYPVGQCFEVDFYRLPNKPQKLVDAGLGFLGMQRFFSSQIYSAAFAAIDRNTDAPIFLHSAQGAIRRFKQRLPKAQVCLYAHNSLFRTFSNRELRTTMDAADRIICVSDFLANALADRLGSRQDKIKVVNTGTDIERFQPNPNPVNPEELVVLFVGRVVPEKGPDLLLKAAQKLADGKRRFKIRIVGSANFAADAPLSDYEQELRKLAEPIRAHVEFLPFVDRKRIVEIYHNANIFCAPSNWDDPCPATVPESLACGLPLVASRRGGIPEVGGDAALYFKPPDTDALATILAGLLDDPASRETWGKRSRARAESLSWFSQYQKLLRALDR